jgi:hypothetical protein
MIAEQQGNTKAAGPTSAAVLEPPFAPLEIAAQLDAMSAEARLDTVMRLGRKQLAPLFEAAAVNPPLRLDDMVPAQTPALVEVVHEGKNSLPAFKRFEKRFCRPPVAMNGANELWGYNHQWYGAMTGPGYFVAHHQDDGELVVDYYRLPPDRPPSWPPIIPNSARLSRFIYYQRVDVIRRVSHHVVVGRAFKKGKPFDAWFALVRCDR